MTVMATGMHDAGILRAIVWRSLLGDPQCVHIGSERDGAVASASLQRGYVQLFAGNHAEAAAAVETALRLDPSLSAINREVAGLVFLVQ